MPTLGLDVELGAGDPERLGEPDRDVVGRRAARSPPPWRGRGRRAGSGTRRRRGGPAARSGASAPCSRRATRRSRRSPAAWPSESLTSLKLSRSRNSSATARSRARASATAAPQPDIELRAVGQLGQRVVEGEPADLRLGVVRARLRVLARGDVDHDALREGGEPVVAVDDRVALPEPHDGAVGGEHPVLRVEALDRLVGAALLGRMRSRSSGWSCRSHSPWSSIQACGGVAEQLLDLGRDVAERRARRPLRHIGDGLDLLDERAEVQLVAQFHLRDYRSPTGTYSRVRSPV